MTVRVKEGQGEAEGDCEISARTYRPALLTLDRVESLLLEVVRCLRSAVELGLHLLLSHLTDSLRQCGD